jgi:hypothetical protein
MIKEIYILVHPDNFKERHELTSSWISDIEEKALNDDILLALFLRDSRINDGNRELLELLKSKTETLNRLILHSATLSGLEFLINNPYNDGIDELNTGSLLPRIDSNTIITARGLYVDRCVIDHIARVYEDYPMITPNNIYIDFKLTEFRNSSFVCNVNDFKDDFRTNQQNTKRFILEMTRLRKYSQDSRLARDYRNLFMEN